MKTVFGHLKQHFTESESETDIRYRTNIQIRVTEDIWQVTNTLWCFSIPLIVSSSLANVSRSVGFCSQHRSIIWYLMNRVISSRKKKKTLQKLLNISTDQKYVRILELLYFHLQLEVDLNWCYIQCRGHSLFITFGTQQNKRMYL